MRRKVDVYGISATLAGLSAVNAVVKIADSTAVNGGNRMDISFTEIVKNAIEMGLVPVLLILFVMFFIRRAKDDDSKVKQAYESAQKNIEENNKILREREDYLLAESAKREEIIRQEGERREKIIRHEAEKRESILMASQDRMMGNLDTIANSLSKMEGAFGKFEVAFSNMEYRLNKIEGKVSSG